MIPGHGGAAWTTVPSVPRRARLRSRSSATARITRLLRVGWVVTAAFSTACAPSLPPAYEQSRAAAERAYVHGRYAEAAAHWEQAARNATRQRDRNEARYRAAVSFQRAGKTAQAARLYEQLANLEQNERAARAAFDRARLEIAHGDEDQGYLLLRRALEQHPDSGLAPGALRSYLRWVSRRGGPTAELEAIGPLVSRLGRTELGEYLHYDQAEALERAGRTRSARDHYLYVADHYPYPQGALWDDALWHASLAEEKLGRYHAAVAHLERMLAEREPPSPPGSYNRPRYDESRFRIAVLYRDRLNDPSAAARNFWLVFTDHPKSLLRDDALWQVALLSRRLGDHAATCDALETLVDELPDSRFAPCAREVCPELPKQGKRSCRPYIRRDLQ
jgi:tetratricopeptide (TPR) repeat protein